MSGRQCFIGYFLNHIHNIPWEGFGVSFEHFVLCLG